MIWTAMFGNGVKICTDLIITRKALRKILKAPQIATIPMSQVLKNMYKEAVHSFAVMNIAFVIRPEAAEKEKQPVVVIILDFVA
jgi:ABC-type polysaccharide/polyol phosphate export permease